MIRFASALLLAASVLGAADEAAPPAPSLWFNALGGTSLSMSPDRPSEAKGGWRVRYEEIRIEGDRLLYRLSPYPGSAKPILASADLFGGPGGPADGHILYDSSTTKLPQVAFRGIMRPRTVAVRRQDGDSGKAGEVRYRAELTDLGDFHGFIRSDQGDSQYLFWADRAVLDYTASLDGSAMVGLGAPRLSVIYLYGRPARDGQPARAAEVMRMTVPVAEAEATVDKQRDAKTSDLYAAGGTPSIYFDEQTGELKSIENMDTFRGDPRLPHKAQSRPAVGK